MTITKRDPRGRILPGGKSISSEQAKEIGSMPKGKKEKLASADQLLRDAGYDEPEDAPERKRLMAQEAAKGSVQAIKAFAGRDEKEAEIHALVQPGDFCPTCAQYVIVDLQLSDDEVSTVCDLIDATRKDLKQKKDDHVEKIIADLPGEPTGDTG